MGEDIQPFDIPGYRVVRWLGRGGMADVYQAIQLSLGRPVAIKVLAAERAPSDELVTRFEQEARIIARLDHPHIVGIFDVGRTSTGQLFYTMPFMPNGDLAARDLAEDQQAVLEIVRAICQALAYAHEQGIVHRDVKPENVLFDKLDRPLLADFGIALTKVGQSRVTREGATLGSVAYMSPEQSRGRPLDGRSDIYSLGVVCYECLTGKVPFSGEDSMAVALAHVEQPVPHLPPARMHWQSLIEKAMAKRPEDRFQSAEEMLHALEIVEKRMAVIAPLAAVATSLAAVPERLERSLNVPVRTRPTSAILIVALGVFSLLGYAAYRLRPTPVGDPNASSVVAPPVAAAAPTLASPLPVEEASAAAMPDAAPGQTAAEPPPPASGEPPPAPAPLAPGAPIHDHGAPETIVVPAVLRYGGGTSTVVHAFALGRYEVTRGEYAEFAQATGRAPASCRQPGRVWSALEHHDWRRPGFDQDDRHPVVCVSWDDANAYVQWLSKRTHHRYRLPSQAEWLHAARSQAEGGDVCKLGNVSDQSDRPLLHLSSRYDCNDGYPQTAPVGRFAASKLGLHDLIGNVSEWTRDCARQPANRSEACPERIYRGTSWWDGPGHPNLEFSDSAKPDVGYTTIGLRVLRELEPEETGQAAASPP